MKSFVVISLVVTAWTLIAHIQAGNILYLVISLVHIFYMISEHVAFFQRSVFMCAFVYFTFVQLVYTFIVQSP